MSSNSNRTLANLDVAAASTPLMRQYAAAKQQNPDALLFFRLGDFYELFYEDAKIAAQELQITLTSRDKERGVPMCGVPYHAADHHIQRLLRRGYRIAICEQVEDPKLTKKLVRREVTRVLTPGTILDPTLHAERSNYLTALCVEPQRIGLALLENSTGDFRATEFVGPDASTFCLDELERIQPSEILLADSSLLPGIAAPSMLATPASRPWTVTHLDAWVFTPDYAAPLLANHFGTHGLAGYGFDHHPAAATAAGSILHYLKATQQSQLQHLDNLRYYERTDYLQLDAVTVRNLELIEPLMPDAGRDTTLFHTLDVCVTPMGKRKLRASLLRPLLDTAQIAERLDAVAELHGNLLTREELRSTMANIQDMERLLSRISLDSAGPRDIVALANSLASLPAVIGIVQSLQSDAFLRLRNQMDGLEDLHRIIRQTLVEDPPVHLSDGGVIATGVHAELDSLRELSLSGKQSIAAIEERERKRTGINSLKVRYNSIFGYYIEITKANLSSAPEDYERKQTLVNAERFTTQELKDYERKVLGAQEECLEIERRIFGELRQTILASAPRIRVTSGMLAELDLIACFAHIASARNYVRPEVEDSGMLEALAARHPVIEWRMQQLAEGRFVPNSVHLDTETTSVLLLTGPNMGGKSTYLRQTALLVILAQMGCFVPAQRMRCGVVDRIYTRIGASDNVAQGRSTFMVEMTETATILNTATERSLVLLDEIGRGTATFDGLSLAWATLEYLHDQIAARTLFATHYHELTMLAGHLARIKNLRVAVLETPTGINFLHTIEEGPASKSYGIDVAKLAGLPKAVIERAREVLRQHERSEQRQIEATTEPTMQMILFTPLSQRVVDQIRDLNLNTLTPLQALNLLQELQREIAESSASLKS
ncbi:MAG TPA: DNA mismatch repair protein MutS [Acidobacteriaceae bacterium]|nr:DNA mismatch repair protein MutS [Acidobacteriaceae bacterium]